MNDPRPEWLHLRPWQRHSLVLAVAGIVYVCIGLAYMVTPATDSRRAALELALLFLPLQVWGILWILVGLLALVSTRWPPASKTWGYTALTALPAAWGSAYLLGVLFLDTAPQYVTGGLVWFLVAFLWWAIAGLMNPDDVPKGR